MSHMHIHKPELIPVTNSGKVMSKTNTMNKLQVRIVYIKVKKEVVGCDTFSQVVWALDWKWVCKVREGEEKQSPDPDLLLSWKDCGARKSGLCLCGEEAGCGSLNCILPCNSKNSNHQAAGLPVPLSLWQDTVHVPIRFAIALAQSRKGQGENKSLVSMASPFTMIWMILEEQKGQCPAVVQCQWRCLDTLLQNSVI